MPIITLENQDLHVLIHTFGAEMHSFYGKKHKAEYLWQADSNYWARHAPVLFPIVGRLNNDTLRSQNKTYTMTQHGFARDLEFDIISSNNAGVQLQLNHTPDTLKQYPFEFQLIIDYTLVKRTLTTTYTIRNPQNRPLPASIGAHPAFNWPLNNDTEKTNHYISFVEEETSPIRQLDNGLLLSSTFNNPIKNKKLMLTDDLFEKDALIFDNLKSRELTYHSENDTSITLRFDDFPHLGIWTKPGAPFICLEPWQGHSSPDDFDGDFSDKPGVMLIPEQSEVKKSFEIILNNY